MKSKIIFYEKDYSKLDEIIYNNEDEKTKWKSTYKLSLPHGLSGKVIIEANTINQIDKELIRIITENKIDSKHIVGLHTDMNWY